MAGKNVSPPPLPHEVLARVWRMAALDGRMLLIIAAVFALFAAAIREAPGTVAGVLAAGAGAMELHGANRLQQGSARGMRWLVASQLGLLLVVLGYIAARLMLFDPAVIEAALTPELEAQLAAAGVAREELGEVLRQFFQAGYALLAVGTCCYQGGMAWYFHRRRHLVRQALEGRQS